MTNHIEQALASLKPLFKPHTISVEEGNTQLQLAQAYASIAIAEQLRIGNLIALGIICVDEIPETGERGLLYSNVDDTLQTPDIAEALGLGGDSDD